MHIGFWVPYLPLALALALGTQALMAKTGVFKSGVRFQGRELASSYVLERKPGQKGVLIHFHGDGGKNSIALLARKLAPITGQRGLAILAPATPGGVSWYGPIDPPNTASPFPHGAHLKAFIEHLIRHEGFDGQRIYLSGVSGGAVFLTGRFIPLYANGFAGGAILLCGGANTDMHDPAIGHVFRNNKAFRQAFSLFFYTMQGDYLLKQTQEGVENYKKQGFRVKAVFPNGGGHCAFDKGLQTTDLIAKGLDWLMQK